jgi:PAS domain S-box-containing protein
MELPLPAVVLTPEGLREDVNEAFCDCFPDKGMASQALGTLSEDIARFRASNKKNEMIEKAVSFSNGQEKLYRIRFSKNISPTNKDLVLLLLTDITERRRQLEEVVRLASIVESSDDAIISIAQDHAVMTWNGGAEKIYGHAAQDIIGRPVTSIISPDHVAGFNALLSDAANGKSFSRFETSNRRLDGREIPVSVTLSPFVFHDKIIGITMVSRDISSRRQTEEELTVSHRRLKNLLHETVEALSTAHEKRDLYTSGHQRFVSMIGCCIADQMNLSTDRMEGIRIAGLLHDIGKICIPMEILAKPTALPREEMALMMEHPLASYEIVKNIPFPWPVKEIILQHHERMDGSGYPKGLKGQAILLEARILAVADVLEAMSAHRPYRQALGLEAAMREILEHAGTKYDQDVCAAAQRLTEEGILRIENNRLVCSL